MILQLMCEAGTLPSLACEFFSGAVGTERTSGVTLSNANLTATGAGAVKATLARSSGKYQVRFIYNGLSGSVVAAVGFETNTGNIDNPIGNNPSSNGYGYSLRLGGFPYHASSSKGVNNTTYGSNPGSAPIIDAYYDASTGQIGFIQNGVDLGVAFTITPGTSLKPAVSPHDSGGVTIITLDPGSSSWSPKTTYLQWNNNP